MDHLTVCKFHSVSNLCMLVLAAVSIHHVRFIASHQLLLLLTQWYSLSCGQAMRLFGEIGGATLEGAGSKH